MKHLYIKQNNNVEIVSSDIIEKLYKISQGEGLDSTSDLIGNLQCTHAYDDAVTYLTTKFKNLQINVTGGSYIRFADDAVRQICATNWGDGIGITAAQAAAVSSVGTKFQANTSITSFDEIKLFTKITKITPNQYYKCSNLSHFIIPETYTYIGFGAFAWINFKYLKCLPIIPPTHDSNEGESAFRTQQIYNIYVPDASVDLYKSATNWTFLASRIKSLSQFSTDFPNG